MPEGALTVHFVTTTMWVMFSAAVTLSIVLGIILSYHFFRFARNSYIALLATLTYSGGCVLFLSTMLAAIIAL